MPGRSVTWTLVQAGSAMFSILCSMMILGSKYMMCFTELWLFNITQVTWCFALMARSLQFYFEYRVNQAKLFGHGAGPAPSLSGEVFAPPSPTTSIPDQNNLNSSMFDAEAAFGTTTTLPPTGLGGSGFAAASMSGPGLPAKAEDRLKGDFYWMNRGLIGDSMLWKIFGGVIGFDVMTLIIVQVRMS
ncbi:hypothetical protein HDV00_001343 [Rhizophlyctis rosea]|nr:hypothetical protein HDV00_001343 [Rhizophlyctis rosea]